MEDHKSRRLIKFGKIKTSQVTKVQFFPPHDYKTTKGQRKKGKGENHKKEVRQLQVNLNWLFEVEPKATFIVRIMFLPIWKNIDINWLIRI